VLVARLVAKAVRAVPRRWLVTLNAHPLYRHPLLRERIKGAVDSVVRRGVEARRREVVLPSRALKGARLVLDLDEARELFGGHPPPSLLDTSSVLFGQTILDAEPGGTALRGFGPKANYMYLDGTTMAQPILVSEALARADGVG
jgi:hypothetical protein